MKRYVLAFVLGEVVGVILTALAFATFLCRMIHGGR